MYKFNFLRNTVKTVAVLAAIALSSSAMAQETIDVKFLGTLTFTPVVYTGDVNDLNLELQNQMLELSGRAEVFRLFFPNIPFYKDKEALKVGFINATIAENGDISAPPIAGSGMVFTFISGNLNVEAETITLVFRITDEATGGTSANMTANYAGVIYVPDTDDEGVTINGVTWATRNVDAPNTFAVTLESAGRFYQWNRKVGYAASGTVDWNPATPTGNEWAAENDPCPERWRVPTSTELQTLLNADNVRSNWVAISNDGGGGVNGRQFTDIASGKSIFLPAAGYRNITDGSLSVVGMWGNYWSNTPYFSLEAYMMYFTDSYTRTSMDSRTNGYCVRCVKSSSAGVNSITNFKEI